MKDLVLEIGTLGAIFAAGLALIPAAFMSNFAFLSDKSQNILDQQFANPQNHSPGIDTVGFKELLRTPLLRMIVSTVFLSQVISSVLYLCFQTYLQQLIPDADKQTSYSLNFYAILNAVSAVCQFVLVPLSLYFFRIFTLQLLVPILNLGFCVAAILYPSMATVGLAFMMFKVFDYSFFRASKEVLYVPLSLDVRYRTKEFIDVFVYRFSKGATSTAIFILQKLGLGLAGYYGQIAAVAALAWSGALFAYHDSFKNIKDDQPSKNSLQRLFIRDSFAFRDEYFDSSIARTARLILILYTGFLIGISHCDQITRFNFML